MTEEDLKLDSIKTSLLFPQPNISELASTLKVVEKAQADAVNEDPKSSLAELQGTESEIVSYVARKRREAVDKAHSLLRALSEQRKRIDADGVKSNLADIPGNCKINIARLNASHQSQLQSLTQTVRVQKKNYDLFRQQNNLLSIAHYPSSKIFHYAVIAAIVILESIANAYFFQRGSELGYIGGLQQAFLFSAINVGLAIFVGDNLFRLKNHIEFSTRIWGWLSLAVYSIVLVGFNLLIGHYRAALQQTVLDNLDPMLAYKMAAQTFLQNPFGIDDVEAWVLVVMGIVVGLFAFLKAYRADDPYPHYGDVQRSYFSHREELERKIAEMRTAVSEEIDKAREKVANLTQDLKEEHRQLLGLLDDAESTPSRLQSHLDDLEDVCNQLLDLYRSHNKKLRQTPIPEYFKKQYEYELNPSLEPASLERERAYAETLGVEISNLREQTDIIREKIIELNESALAHINQYSVT